MSLDLVPGAGHEWLHYELDIQWSSQGKIIRQNVAVWTQQKPLLEAWRPAEMLSVTFEGHHVCGRSLLTGNLQKLLPSKRQSYFSRSPKHSQHPEGQRRGTLTLIPRPFTRIRNLLDRGPGRVQGSNGASA